jgi:uncharacterized protein GlcG (DUF336 family)
VKRFFIAAALVLGLAATMTSQDTSSGSGPDAAAAFTCPAPDPTNATSQILTVADVCTAITNAASAVNSPLVIAVTDRQGDVLAVYNKANAPTMATANFGVTADANEVAIALARTASFFSNDNAPLTSRTVRFISGVHFPPAILYTPNADLYGIENTNRGCDFNVTFLPGQFIPRATAIFDDSKPEMGSGSTLQPGLADGTRPGLGIMTGKGDIYDSFPGGVAPVNPGGVPLFRNIPGVGNVVLGGIGVVGPNYQISEYAAAVAAGFTGGAGAALPPTFSIAIPPPGVVIVGGIALPEVFQNTLPAGSSTGAMDGFYLSIPDTSNPSVTVGGQPLSVPPVNIPQASPNFAPQTDLIQEKAGTLLSLSDVQTIVNQSIATANTIRGVIRLPLGTRARMVIAVSDLDGTLLALYRMVDATIFSIDVAVAKSRNVIYFTNNPLPDLPGYGKPPGLAITNRTISFGAQPFFPPGIDTSDPAPKYPTPGPFFNLFTYDTANPCSQGVNQPNPGTASPNQPGTTPYNGTGPFSTYHGNVSGIVFFPGAVPLYKNGVMVGGLGISGDGVDQDDYVTNGGAQGFLAPESIRADNVFIRGVRMPYQKYPRNPTD